MKKSKLLELVLIAVFMLLALEFIIFPGLESHNFMINVVSLTSFVLLVLLVVFGVNTDQNNQ